MTKESYIDELEKYLPKGTAKEVAELLWGKPVRLVISKARHSKLGDFRPKFGNRGHQISINHNLNPYSFLVTLVHEIAHFYVWMRYENNVKPHGKEWKDQFRILMLPFLQEGVLPDNVRYALVKHMKNPKASSTSDPVLRKELIKYDQRTVTLLEDIPENAVFMMNGNRVFQKGNKQRTRYRCLDMINKRYYLINRSAEVRLINKEFIRE